MAAKKKPTKKRTAKKSNTIPLEVLEKRARELARLVRARGGSV